MSPWPGAPEGPPGPGSVVLVPGRAVALADLGDTTSVCQPKCFSHVPVASCHKANVGK